MAKTDYIIENKEIGRLDVGDVIIDINDRVYLLIENAQVNYELINVENMESIGEWDCLADVRDEIKIKRVVSGEKIIITGLN
ncbi:hypothetical protein [Clostridium felsineum]|uniref:hypothetical protein n=1 Tax=Clostridium felsineum TaxID=36839 RepID=UPI00098BE9CA|nr:hypothetical protein [Clostridium felsineum]URZ16904.1 hypothetical protein CLFE_029510 [Clostridium felsineum DSM 794]